MRAATALTRATDGRLPVGGNGHEFAQPHLWQATQRSCFNEQEALPAFHRQLAAALSAVQGEWEVVYVDDGSTDATQRVLRKLQAGDPAVEH